MNRRPLGSTGIEVGEIGLGCWQLANPAWGGPGEEESLAIVDEALRLGVNLFDTAPGYGRAAARSSSAAPSRAAATRRCS